MTMWFGLFFLKSGINSVSQKLVHAAKAAFPVKKKKMLRNIEFLNAA